MFSTKYTEWAKWDCELRYFVDTEGLVDDLDSDVEAQLDVVIQFTPFDPGDFYTAPAGGYAQIVGWNVEALWNENGDAIPADNPLYSLACEHLEKYIDKYLQNWSERIIMDAIASVPNPFE